MAFGPIVRLGDVAIMAQHVRYAWSAGTAPGELALLFKPAHAKVLLDAAKGRTTLGLSIDYGVAGFKGGASKIALELPPLFLLEPDGSQSPYETILRLADVRVLLQGIRVSSTFNVRRDTAELEGLVQDANGVRTDDSGTGIGASGTTSRPVGGLLVGDQLARPGAALRRNARARQDYLEWTIKATGTPYTAREICVHLLETASAQVAGSLTGEVVNKMLHALRQSSHENRFVRDNVMIRGEALTDLLDRWLANAELGIAPKMKGDLEFFAWWTGDDRPLDEVLKPFPATVMSGGFLSTSERKRIRAANVDVRFARQVEALIRLMGDSRLPGEPGGPDDSEAQRRAFNVLQLPDDVVYDGEVWHKGTWVSLPFALEIWVNNSTNNLTRFDPDVQELSKYRQWIRNAGVRGNDWSRILREFWFNAQLMGYLTLRVQASGLVEPDRIWGVRLAELRKRFLTTWQLDPTLYSYVLEVKPERAKMVSAVHGLPAVPYVSCDHFETYVFTIPEIKGTSGAKGGVNVAGAENPKDAVGAPASLRFERPDIFTLSYDDAYEGRWFQGQVVPCNVVEDTIPPAHYAAKARDNPDPELAKTWYGARLAHPNVYKGFVILSFVFGTTAGDNERKGTSQRQALTHLVRVPAAAAGFPGATNPEITVDLAATEEVAKFALNDGLDVDPDPVNPKALEALAVAHARRYYFSMRDRLQGSFTVPGWHDEFRLFGSLRSITITLNAGAEMTTTFDATGAPSPPDLRSLLPDDVRRQVFRELPLSRAARRAGAP